MAENSLNENPFAYRLYKNGSISIEWKHREVKLLKGKSAEKFLSKIAGKSGAEIQLELAKITGNFKRGNEREGKLKNK